MNSKTLDIFQWLLTLGAVISLLYVSWRMAVIVAAVDGIIGLARIKWRGTDATTT